MRIKSSTLYLCSVILLFGISIPSLVMSAYSVSKLPSCTDTPPLLSGTYAREESHKMSGNDTEVKVSSKRRVRYFVPTNNPYFVVQSLLPNERRSDTDRKCMWNGASYCTWTLWCVENDDVAFFMFEPNDIVDNVVRSMVQSYYETGPPSLSPYQEDKVIRAILRKVDSEQ